MCVFVCWNAASHRRALPIPRPLICFGLPSLKINSYSVRYKVKEACMSSRGLFQAASSSERQKLISDEHRLFDRTGLVASSPGVDGQTGRRADESSRLKNMSRVCRGGEQRLHSHDVPIIDIYHACQSQCGSSIRQILASGIRGLFLTVDIRSRHDVRGWLLKHTAPRAASQWPFKAVQITPLLPIASLQPDSPRWKTVISARDEAHIQGQQQGHCPCQYLGYVPDRCA